MAIAKDELEIRERILKCMNDVHDRMSWCCNSYADQHPGVSPVAVKELYEKCARAVVNNIEFEKAISGHPHP